MFFKTLTPFEMEPFSGPFYLQTLVHLGIVFWNYVNVINIAVLVFEPILVIRNSVSAIADDVRGLRGRRGSQSTERQTMERLRELLVECESMRR